MRVIGDLLKKLNVTAEYLMEYKSYLNLSAINFENPLLSDTVISEEVYNKIINAHRNKVIQQKTEILAYVENNNYRFIAKVKWYYNHQTRGEYGFLELLGFPDIHFTSKSYLYNNPLYLKPGDEVVVTLNKRVVDSKKSNIKAVAVNNLSDETDINFLLFYLVNHFQSIPSQKIDILITQISKLSVQLTDDGRKAIQLFIEDNIKLEDLEIEKTKHIPSLLKACQLDLSHFNKYLNKLNSDQKFQLWKYSEDIEIAFESIKESLSNCMKDFLNKDSLNVFKGSRIRVIGSITLINNEMKLFSRVTTVQQKMILDDLLEELCISYENNKFEYLTQILGTYHSFNIPVDFEYLSTKLSTTLIFNVWLKKDFLSINFDLIKKEFIQHLKNTPLNQRLNLLVRLNIEQKKEILDQLFIETCLLSDNHKFDYLVSIINFYNQFEIPVNYKNIPKEQHLRLWEDGFIIEFPFDQVYDKLMKIKKEYYDSNPKIIEALVENIQYLERIQEADLKNILAKSHFELEVINDKETFNTVLFFIKHIPETFKVEYINAIHKKASNYYKLQLFILDYIDAVDYNEVIIYTGLLSSESQKTFFKKIIKLIAENKINVNLEDLNRITTIDYQTSEYAKEIDGVGLDFTLSVILKVLTDLKNNIPTSRNTIFDLVSNQIKSPKDLLVIDGFFEKCSGKTIIEVETHTLENGENITSFKKTKKENFKPRFSTFCDGRKAVSQETNEPILCKKSGLEFWWCENSQCYDVCRKTHTPSQWKNYTLEDVLRILKISYKEVQYEILLNVINRVNRFLTHLSCRKCNSILKPKGKANYAFFGVTMFSCKNKDCEENSKDIYLSHCLNGECEDIIDSRDSVKCKSHGYDGECGWYICKNCNACCSSEKLIARKNNLERLGQEYKGHLIGHRNRGIICCSKCGNEMNELIVSIDSYKKQLNWFLEKKDRHPNILKSDQRVKDKKWWFIWIRGNYSYEEYRKQLQSLLLSGFSIPDFNNKERDNQLIAEPFEKKKVLIDKVFVCPSCDSHFDLNNYEDFDYTRKRAIQKFHNKIFPEIEK